jgi:hypothetical protein
MLSFASMNISTMLERQHRDLLDLDPDETERAARI